MYDPDIEKLSMAIIQLEACIRHEMKTNNTDTVIKCCEELRTLIVVKHNMKQSIVAAAAQQSALMPARQ